MAERVPSAAGWAQALSLGVTEVVTVPSETQPATDRTLLLVLAVAHPSLGHIRQESLILLLVKSASVFGIGFSEPSPTLPLCLPWFSLVAPLPLSGLHQGFLGGRDVED